MDASAGAADELARLRLTSGELRAALDEVRGYLVRLGRMSSCETIDELLDVGDALLLETVDFVYYRFYLDAGLAIVNAKSGPEESGLRLVRTACPDTLPVDWDLVAWARENREISLLPAAPGSAPARSVLVVPLAAHRLSLGVLLIWVEFDAAGFTEQSSGLLRTWAGWISAALESLELAEQRVRTQAFVHHVLESVPVGILSLDGRGVMTFVNGTAEFMLDISRKEALGRDYVQVLRPEAADLVGRMVRRLGQGEDPGEEELRFSGSDGAEIILGVTGTGLVLPGSEANAGCVIVTRDMEAAREVARLREIDAMKDDLISLVSHELRTPLASIMAYAEALLMEGMVETETERREYLEVIRGEGDRLGRLINDVLDLSKMQAGKMEYHFAPHDMNEVVKHGVAVQTGMAKAKGVRIKQSLATGLPKVRLDRDRIIQVVCNILSNAIKYTDAGGEILVKTAYLPAADRPASVELQVVDTGIGIPENQVHKVWSRFEQVENTRHHTGGTGLGMPICRQIVEEGHGGQIWLTSKVGKGTTVYCHLPL
jgi:PAS domain S-box-containing protein